MNKNKRRRTYPFDENDKLSTESHDSSEAGKIEAGLRREILFNESQCRKLEEKLEEVVRNGDIGVYKPHTVDRAPLRNKYFFGEAYTYGAQLGAKKGLGHEKLFPKGEVDEIPQWVWDMVVKPIVQAGLVEDGFVNSCAINIYQPGGCIVSHIDPPQIFDRPILTLSLFSDSALSFGCKFSFKPMRTTEPIVRTPVARGCVLLMSDYAADGVTHCIRPQDVVARRGVIILRRCLPDAPRLSKEESLHILSAHHMRNNYSHSLPARNRSHSSHDNKANRREDTGSYRRRNADTTRRPRSKSPIRHEHERDKDISESIRKRTRSDDIAHHRKRNRNHHSEATPKLDNDKAGNSKSNSNDSCDLSHKPKLSLVACYGSSTENDSSDAEDIKARAKRRRKNARRMKSKSLMATNLTEEKVDIGKDFEIIE